MGHHYGAFNKSNDDAAKKKEKKKKKSCCVGMCVHLAITFFFLFFFLLLLILFFNIRNQLFTPKQVRSKRKRKRAFQMSSKKKSLLFLSPAWKLFSRFSSSL
jgi:uncharacterized protein YqhQ